MATRESVGLFDLTGLSIIEVAGPDALTLVDSICSNKMDVALGRIVYTTWLTENGGVRRDLAVARLGLDRFWMFVGEGTRPRDFDWVRRASVGHGVAVIDLSDAYTAIGLWGPSCPPRFCRRSARADVSNEAFPYFTARWIDAGFARAMALRISYVGELGWEFHIPNEFALPLWDLSARRRARRRESFPPGWEPSIRFVSKRDIEAGAPTCIRSTTRIEAGLGWTVKLDKAIIPGIGGGTKAER